MRGYDAAVIGARRSHLLALFDGPDDRARQAASGQIGALGGPLVLLLAAGRHPAPTGWLERAGTGRRAHADPAYEVWLVPQARPQRSLSATS